MGILAVLVFQFPDLTEFLQIFDFDLEQAKKNGTSFTTSTSNLYLVGFAIPKRGFFLTV